MGFFQPRFQATGAIVRTQAFQRGGVIVVWGRSASARPYQNMASRSSSWPPARYPAVELPGLPLIDDAGIVCFSYCRAGGAES
jgi:hypothetical protein